MVRKKPKKEKKPKETQSSPGGYPESNIINMIEGYKVAQHKGHDRRASEIKRFLADRNVKINQDNTWIRI